MFEKCLPKKAFMREMMKISKIVTISRKYHKYKDKYTFLPLPIKTYIYIYIYIYIHSFLSISKTKKHEILDMYI